MVSPTQFDKTLIALINAAAALIATGMVLVTLYTFIDLPDRANDYWGLGTLAAQVLDHYSQTGV